MKNLFRLLPIAVAAMFSLSGCATDRTIGMAAGIEATDLRKLPVPDSGRLVSVRPLEKLDIRVVGVDSLSGSYTVDDDGSLRFPFVGQVPVEGISHTAVADRIASGLRGRYVLAPQVLVQPGNTDLISVSIGGQVDRPGTYPAETSGTLIRAVNNAGGLTDTAKSDDVVILRTVSGKNYVGVFNLAAIQRGNYKDPTVYPSDIIYVGDSPARRSLETFLQFVPLLSTAAIFVDRIGN